MELIEVAASRLDPSAVRVVEAALCERARIGEHSLVLRLVCARAIVDGEPFRHLRDAAVEPARVVRSAELRRVPGENPVRRPLRKPFLALLERGEVEVEVRGRNVGLCPIGMGEVQAVGVHLAGNRGGELDIVHDSALFAHLPEDLGAHIALGAYLVDAGRGGHNARIVAPRSHPRL